MKTRSKNSPSKLCRDSADEALYSAVSLRVTKDYFTERHREKKERHREIITLSMTRP